MCKVKYAPTPVDAIAKLVRTYAKKVRSAARWSRATLPVFSSVSVGFIFSAHADTSRFHRFFLSVLLRWCSSSASEDSSGVISPLPHRNPDCMPGPEPLRAREREWLLRGTRSDTGEGKALRGVETSVAGDGSGGRGCGKRSSGVAGGGWSIPFAGRLMLRLSLREMDAAAAAGDHGAGRRMKDGRRVVGGASFGPVGVSLVLAFA